MNKADVKRLPDEVRKSIPNNEKIHWNGEPSWASLGYQVFGIKYLIFYFILSALYAVSQLGPVFSLLAFLVHYVPFLISGAVAASILFVLAYLATRHTSYVITEKRIVIRTGVALVFLLNVPLKNIISIDKQRLAGGRGNLSFEAKSKKRIPFLSCWPSVKSGSFVQPSPAFRSISNIEEIGVLITELAEKTHEQRYFDPKSANSGVAA